jgi:hypothetical protein
MKCVIKVLWHQHYVTIAIVKFHQKKSKILQILQLAICQLICNMHDWKIDGLNIGHSCMTQHILWKKRKLRIAVYNLQCVICYCNDHINTKL